MTAAQIEPPAGPQPRTGPPPSADATAPAASEVPAFDAAAFAERCRERCREGGRLAALVALPSIEGGPPASRDLFAIIADDRASTVELCRTRVAEGGHVPSLTPALPAAQAFEREIWETHGIVPDGHPWLKPLIAHPELANSGARAEHPFFRVAGSGVHEVAVGPVHAGVIEPGHFRFQCHGETVLSLEIHLGYQHRGAEALLLRSNPARRLSIAESIAGDMAIGHALAYCHALERLSGAEPPVAAEAVRVLALELERLANHVGDLGALCNDVGFLPGAAWFGRLRGDFLNLLMDLSGNRFGRGLVRIGGVRFGLAKAACADFAARIAATRDDLERVVSLTFSAPSVLARFERTGVVTKAIADELGLVGPVARASGCPRDVRRDHPWGMYRSLDVPVTTADTGDVMARALVRHLEARSSLDLASAALERLDALEGAPLTAEAAPPRANRVAAAFVEGWRGEIVHIATTGADGRLLGYRVVDPSFHNWFGLAMALRDNEISDFPLCNKSFNLSYAGHDR